MMKKEIKFFTQKELKKIFSIIEKSKERHSLRNLAIFRIAYRCGLRASEVGLINVSDFNKQRREIYCHRLKGSNNNTIRLDDETYRVLTRYIREYGLKDNDVLFSSQEKRPIERKMLYLLMKKYCSIAKVADKSKWRFHTLKHSIAVHLAESGLDIKELQYWLGHKNVNNTMIYFQFTTAQQDMLYKKIEKSNFLV